MIVVLGFFVFGVEKGLYGIAAIYACTKAIDYVLVGGDIAKSALIVTDKPEEVSNSIFGKIRRGVTALHGKGMYTGDEKLVLYCIVSKKEIVTLKEAVKEADNKAFVSIGEVHEVVGEGFKSYNDTSL